MAKVYVGSGWVETSDGSLGGSLTGRLSPRERALFARLAEVRGEVVELMALGRAVWGDDKEDGRRVKVLVKRVRTKIEPDPAQPRFVLTALRRGYSLAADSIAPAATPVVFAAKDAGLASPDAGATEVELPALFGRAAEQEQLEAWLLRRHGRWLTLTGVGGVGKSALLGWAHARARTAGLTCRHVSLAEVETVEALLQRVARAGEIPVAPGVEPEALLASALRSRRGLWIFDDLSSLDAEAIETLDRLFAPLVGVRILASRRQPLRSLDEAVFPVSPLGPEAAVEMWRALSRDPGSRPPESMPRLPLWVRLSAAASDHAGDEVVSESDLVRGAIERAPARQALELLGWHPGETHSAMLIELLEVSSQDLEAWRRAGLTEVLPEGRVRVHPVIRETLRARSSRADRLGQSRRKQLERLVQYVQTQARQAFEQQPLLVRRQLLDYLDHLLAWARGLRPDELEPVFEALPMLLKVVIGSGRERAWADTLHALAARLDRRDEARVAAKLRLAVTGISEHLVAADAQLRAVLEIDREALDPCDRDLRDLMIAVGHMRHGEVERAYQILAPFEERVAELSPEHRVRYRSARAAALRAEGRHQESVVEARAAVAEARASVPMLETAALLWSVAAYQEAGLNAESEQALEQALEAAERWDDLAARATCLRQQAQQAMHARRVGRALQWAEQALALMYPGSNDYVFALYTAAVANRQTGAYDRSAHLLEQALAEATEQSLTRLIPLVLDSLGNALVHQEDLDGALLRYHEAIQAAEACGDLPTAKRIHSNVAQVHLLNADLAAAARHQDLARDDDSAHAAWRLAWAWREAAVRFGMGKHAEAREHANQVLDLAVELESIDGACSAALLVSTWLYALGHASHAVQVCEAIHLGAEYVHLVRRLPLALRVGLQQPATPELVSTASLTQAALEKIK